MPREFVTEKDREFIKGVRSEIDENLVRQELLYYRIDMDKSTVDEVYGEITKKVYDAPVSFYARCRWEEPEQRFEGATSDTIYRMEVFCDPDQLERRGIVAKAGDVLERHADFYEIESAVLTKPLMGQIDEKIELRMMVRSCRTIYFDAPTHAITVPKDHYSGTMNPSIPATETYGESEIVWPGDD